MNNSINPMDASSVSPMPSKSKLPVFVLIIILVLVVLAGVWYFLKTNTTLCTGDLCIDRNAEDTTTKINSDLNSIDFGNLDKDFETVDGDINSL